MVSIKTTLADYFIPATETADEILSKMAESTSGFISVTLPDGKPIHVNINTVIQFIEISDAEVEAARQAEAQG